MSKRTMEELEDKYRGLCTILLFLSLTREIGDEARHDLAVQKTEAGLKAVCKEIEELKRNKAEEAYGGEQHEYPKTV